ncbi:MAG TPA: FAD-binding protein, partial [Solirubrobacteraceae bacterium]|nr:FAD-binding protein [Solirubrobacteraceae bacterium]
MRPERGGGMLRGMSLLMPAIHRFSGTLEDGVARCESVADAAAVLAHADVPVEIDVSALNAVHVDPVRRIAWVQPGATWRELDAAAQEDGLAVTGARLADTTVVETVLGSGGGWLERRLGLPADNLRAARVLLASGRVVTASATENADLFWALCGGDASLGIVVELELALRPVGPTVLGGMLLWGRDRAPEV